MQSRHCKEEAAVLKRLFLLLLRLVEEEGEEAAAFAELEAEEEEEEEAVGDSEKMSCFATVCSWTPTMRDLTAGRRPSEEEEEAEVENSMIEEKKSVEIVQFSEVLKAARAKVLDMAAEARAVVVDDFVAVFVVALDVVVVVVVSVFVVVWRRVSCERAEGVKGFDKAVGAAVASTMWRDSLAEEDEW